MIIIYKYEVVQLEPIQKGLGHKIVSDICRDISASYEVIFFKF